VTCLPLLRRHPAAAEFLGEQSWGPLVQLRALAARLSARIRRDDVVAQFARFVLVGGASTAGYAVLFIALDGFGYLTANVAATVVSSVLANELHRRLTFRADERVGFWTSQVEAGGVSLFGLIATSIAAVTGAIGMMRFIALRWIFGPALEPSLDSPITR
jgi:putative flippase GtrA